MKVKRDCVVSNLDGLITNVCMQFVLLLMGIKCITGEQTDAPTGTSNQSKPFYETSMFIGLALGLGIFVGLLLLCCAVWKFCCPKKNS
ncbi:hypothetical protein ACJMK2_028578 [Sinanodonta woodiana]|uniref:Uncharacterized protein n=1 Tax=Sinanodonta woodiana TaxID=1069815 RepID=A0ABD3X9M2_SINWO